MKTTFFSLFFVLIFLFCSNTLNVKAQTEVIQKDTVSLPSDVTKGSFQDISISNDSVLLIDSLPVNDTLYVDADSVVVEEEKEFLETKVVRSSDSSTLNMRERKAYLYGSADVTYGKINLTSAYMEIDFEQKTVYATGLKDSTGKEYGLPVFKEGETTFSAEKITYNFDTKKGLVYNVVTKEGEGYLHGTVVKKLEDDAMFIKDGWFTTCDHVDHPHFAFKFGKAKVIPDDKIVTGPVYMMIEDIPTPLALPFGWFPNMDKRRSGIVIPSINQRTGIGFGLEKGGYYWYINDNVDLKLTGDIFTRGSWALQTESRYAKRYKFNGNVLLSYAKNIKGDQGTSDYFNESNYRIVWQHQQDPKARPNSRFSANVNIQSSNYQKFNSVSTNDYLTTSYSSSIAYSTKLGSYFNFSANAGYTQNTSNKTISLTLPKISLSSTQIYPFRRKKRIGAMKWYENINITYTMNAENKISTLDSMLLKEPLYPKMNYGMKHTIPIRSSVKVLKFLNWNNSINYTEYWYGRSFNKQLIADTDSTKMVKTDTLNHFYSTREFSLSSDLSTTLYGIFAFKKGALQAVRHVLKPSVGFSFHPDFGDPFWGNYDTYEDVNGNEVRYSHYQNLLYGGPSDGM
ncbi:MAG: putative LPS assembly protein LptD, partial [Bacteroidales bacterium]|nr:putative LPS assembly protein LptD [Bacteroidales bacterium]